MADFVVTTTTTVADDPHHLIVEGSCDVGKCLKDDTELLDFIEQKVPTGKVAKYVVRAEVTFEDA